MENFELLSEIIVSNNEVDITALESSKTLDGLFIEENLEKREDTFFVDDDLRQLESLLNDFNLLQLLPILQAANGAYRCLQYIQKENLIEAIPHLGLRVEFRKELFMWRKKEFGIDDDTISNPNKVVDWLNKDYSNVPSPSSSNSSVKRVLNKAVKRLVLTRFIYKNYLANTTSRINPPHSLDIKSGIQVSHFLLEHEFSYDLPNNFEAYPIQDLTKESFFSKIVGTNNIDFTKVRSLKEVIYKGTIYKNGYYIVSQKPHFRAFKIFLFVHQNSLLKCFMFSNNFKKFLSTFPVI